MTFGRVAFTVLVLPLLLYVYREVTRDVLIIDPFTVPKRFEETGLTSEVMANRIGDTLHEIETTTQPECRRIRSPPDTKKKRPRRMWKFRVQN
jgi:hypothetical protein